MAYTAKLVTADTDTAFYELFTTAEEVDVSDKKVVIKKSIGRFSKAELEQEKVQLQSQIDEIDSKLKVINSL